MWGGPWSAPHLRLQGLALCGPQQARAAPGRPRGPRPALHRRPLSRQALLAKAPFTDCAELGLHTILALDCVFSLCEQKVSVSYLKSIYNIPFEQLGVTRLSVNGTVCYRIKDNVRAFEFSLGVRTSQGQRESEASSALSAPLREGAHRDEPSRCFVPLREHPRPGRPQEPLGTFGI